VSFVVPPSFDKQPDKQANNTNAVATLDTPFADPDMETMRQKMNEMLLAMRRQVERALRRAFPKRARSARSTGHTISQKQGNYEGREERKGEEMGFLAHPVFASFAPVVVISFLSDCFWKMVSEPLRQKPTSVTSHRAGKMPASPKGGTHCATLMPQRAQCCGPEINHTHRLQR
jgi:hypothetical protein